MVVLNVLAQLSWPPRLSSLYKEHHHRQQQISFPISFSTSNPSSKSILDSSAPSQIPISSAGKSSSLPSNDGCSWLQDTSRCHDAIASNGHRPRLLHSAFATSPAAVTSVENLFDFICSGPLIENLGLTPEMVSANIDKWLECGLYLSRLFGVSELSLTTPQKARLYHYYVPVFLWCEDQISRHRSKFEDGDDIPPLMIGFSAPQGSGKTTLVFALDYLFRVRGRNSATLSIDDFYLTHKDQHSGNDRVEATFTPFRVKGLLYMEQFMAKLRSENPGNALLELRGNAGSHDLQFSIDTLTRLSKLTKQGMKMKLPRYDKSAYGGKGDRADPSTWPDVEGPLEVVLFEGWMLGFKPLPNKVVKAVDPQLEVVNKNLEAYYNAWDKFIEAWIVIKIKDPSCVFQWRLQAEVAMRADGKPGMSDEEVLDFVSRYLPAYKAYLPTLYSQGPNGSDPDRVLVVEIDEERNPILAA